jgi:hypothetical protein
VLHEYASKMQKRSGDLPSGAQNITRRDSACLEKPSTMVILGARSQFSLLPHKLSGLQMPFLHILIAAAGLFVTVTGSFSGNWTTQKWDVIVVGAGPAGIIGKTIEIP